MGCPAAQYAQEGLTLSVILWVEFDCLFVAGRAVFKEGPVVRDACRECRRRGKWVHMGQINGLSRLLIALDFGVDSVDGTYLLHEARKGRAWDAPHDVFGWLRRLHTELRRALRLGLGGLGVEYEQIEALMDQLR